MRAECLNGRRAAGVKSCLRHLIGIAVLVCSVSAPAGEYAVLKNGHVLRADRHETVGDKVILYANGGTAEIDASSIEEFQPEVKPPETPEPSKGSSSVDAKQLLNAAARRYGLPAKLLHSIAQAESGYQQSAVSPAGAIGIMQLMPATARKLGADPHDPEQNVDAGARYLVDLLRKYADDDHQLRKALAAYNAGPNAVDRYNGVPPYPETQKYVEKVIRQAGLRSVAAK
jgi:hypothetical protein